MNAKTLRHTLVWFALFSSPLMAQQTNQTQELVNASAQRLAENQSAQQDISKVHDQTHDLMQAYQENIKVLEGLNIYNAMMQKQLDKQAAQHAQLRHSIGNASQVERQVMPLLVRMVSALHELVQVDMPFLLEERTERVTKLCELLESPSLTLAEKSRRVFEAYQIEMDYGYTIETYKGRLQQDNQNMAVEYLRVGRVALMYQDINGEHVGHWDRNTLRWQPLTDSQFRRHINKGLRIAKEEIAPELITIPFAQTVEAR